MTMPLKTSLAAALGITLWAGCGQKSSSPEAAMKPATQPAAAVATNTRCPVMPEDAIDPKVTYVHNGKTYAFCCEGCIDDFKKDPEKYAKATR